LAALIWTRVDKWRERKAVEKANLPMGRLYWNPHIDETGWYMLKFDFSDVKVPVKITEASASSGTLTLARSDGDQFVEGRTIPLQWNFEVNPKHIAYLCFRPAKTDQKALTVKLRGNFQTGSMLPVKLELTAVR
jgi:hypothetical protein